MVFGVVIPRIGPVGDRAVVFPENVHDFAVGPKIIVDPAREPGRIKAFDPVMQGRDLGWPIRPFVEKSV